MQVFFDERIFQMQPCGGVSRYICELARALAETGDISVTVYGGWSANRHIAELRSGPNLRVIHARRPGGLRINSLARTLSARYRTLAFRQALRRDADLIYHTSFFDFDDHLLPLARSRVATVYDMIHELFPDSDKNAQRYQNAKRVTAQKADRLICISQSTADDMSRFYALPAEKATVIHLSCGVVPVSPGIRADVLSRYALDRTPFFLLVGNRGTYKNGIAAFRAFAAFVQTHGNARLVLCGGGSLSEKEAALAREAGFIESLLQLHPDDETLAVLLSAATALLYPSRYEGFGLPVLEAMALGCPVITTRCGGIPEVGGDAALYVDPDSPGEIVEMMRRVLDPAQHAAIVAAGKRQAERFSPETMAQRTLAAYADSLLG